MANLEIVGYFAGFLMAIALAPQLIKTWRTKSAKDISILWTLIVIFGLFLWVVYAISNKILPLFIFASIEFFNDDISFCYEINLQVIKSISQ